MRVLPGVVRRRLLGRGRCGVGLASITGRWWGGRPRGRALPVIAMTNVEVIPARAGALIWGAPGVVWITGAVTMQCGATAAGGVAGTTILIGETTATLAVGTASVCGGTASLEDGVPGKA